MKTLLIPERLKKGDLIGLISPSSPTRYPERITQGISYLIGKGYYVRLGWSVGSEEGYLAGSDDLRVHDLHEMFLDERVGAILCTRGGYGSGRLLDLIDYDLVRAHPKILVGFSDITALSMALLSQCGLLTFAGPMVAAEFASASSAMVDETFWQMVAARKARRILTLGEEKVMKEGVASGPLIGGNLAVYCSLIGSKYLPDPKGSILFLEEVGENVYRIDRMLLQLKHAGILGAISGIILGSFTAIPEDEPNREIDAVLREYLMPLNIPILSDFPFGHIPEKVTMPMGANVKLDTKKRQLAVTQAVVS